MEEVHHKYHRHGDLIVVEVVMWSAVKLCWHVSLMNLFSHLYPAFTLLHEEFELTFSLHLSHVCKNILPFWAIDIWQNRAVMPDISLLVVFMFQQSRKYLNTHIPKLYVSLLNSTFLSIVLILRFNIIQSIIKTTYT